MRIHFQHSLLQIISMQQCHESKLIAVHTNCSKKWEITVLHNLNISPLQKKKKKKNPSWMRLTLILDVQASLIVDHYSLSSWTHLFCCCFILACCLTSYAMDSSHDGMSCLVSTSKVSRSRQTLRFRSLKNDVANPRFPTRPVRPMRWTYSSMSLGRSKFTTCFTFGMSSPLAATYIKFSILL